MPRVTDPVPPAVKDIPATLDEQIAALERELARLYAERDRDEARFLVTIYSIVTRNEFSAGQLLAHTCHAAAARRAEA